VNKKKIYTYMNIRMSENNENHEDHHHVDVTNIGFNWFLRAHYCCTRSYLPTIDMETLYRLPPPLPFILYTDCVPLEMV
jgi:hypothetical protein